MTRNFGSAILLWLNAFHPPALWGFMIFFLSAQSTLPSFNGSIADFIFKKSAHVTVYAVLYLLLYRGVSKTCTVQHSDKQWLIPALLSLGYAMSDEFHQLSTPGRSGTIRDIGFDMLGVFIVLLRQYQYI